VSKKTTDRVQPPRLQIDFDKMLRFARWLFAEETQPPNRSEDQLGDEASEGQSAA
jgi:hypothetical protein